MSKRNVTVRSETVDRLVVLGYIMAVSMPPLGLVMAVVVARLSSKTNAKHAIWIVLVSLIASVVWIVIISAGALNTPTTDY